MSAVLMEHGAMSTSHSQICRFDLNPAVCNLSEGVMQIADTPQKTAEWSKVIEGHHFKESLSYIK